MSNETFNAIAAALRRPVIRLKPDEIEKRRAALAAATDR
jgi:hypothetical protein